MDIKEFVFDFEGNTVHYKSFGKGKPLVILHGWGSNSDVMLPLASTLKVKRTIYLVDFPGFGKSPEPTTAWTVSDYTRCIATFINSISKTPADILAHSFGGRVTLKLCSNDDYKSLVDRVIITGGAGMKPRRPPKYYLKKYTARFIRWPFTLLPKSMSEKSLEWLRTTYVWKALGSADYRTLKGVMRDTFVKTVSEYLEFTLPKIDHDVLLLWGANDDATPIYQAKIMERGIKNAGLAIIDNAGHYAFLDRPHQFKVITETFLSS
jgi:pimeloyl-ACP methyl ester carboxylesterase